MNKIIITIVAMLPALAVAAPRPNCPQELRSCLALGATERGRCLNVVSESLTCRGTPLGELAERRSLTDSPIDAAGDEGALAFLGDRDVNGQCLANFDNLLSSYLLKGDPNPTTIELLHTTLDGCLGGPSLELPTP